MDNQTLFDNALAAINRLFSDTSVPVETCIDNLENLIEEINTMLQALEENDG